MSQTSLLRRRSRSRIIKDFNPSVSTKLFNSSMMIRIWSLRPLGSTQARLQLKVWSSRPHLPLSINTLLSNLTAAQNISHLSKRMPLRLRPLRMIPQTKRIKCKKCASTLSQTPTSRLSSGLNLQTLNQRTRYLSRNKRYKVSGADINRLILSSPISKSTTKC